MIKHMLAVSALLALAACQRSAPPQAATATPLERPVFALSVKSGERIRIPRAALVERAGVPGAFVLTDEGVARFRMLRPGKTAGERMEILAGLTGNERLVLGDLREVRDGSPIRNRNP